MAQVHHLERLGIVLGVVLVVALPIAHQGWPMTAWATWSSRCSWLPGAR